MSSLMAGGRGGGLLPPPDSLLGLPPPGVLPTAAPTTAGGGEPMDIDTDSGPPPQTNGRAEPDSPPTPHGGRRSVGEATAGTPNC